MGLFDDDFYSTKVSRRQLRRSPDGNQRWQGNKRRTGWSTLQISLVSSILSAVVAVLLFNLITGLPSASNQAGANGSSSAGMGGDSFDRISTAAAKVAPAVVSILNHSELSGEDPEQAALGSGVIYKKDKGKAYIITNTHVIAGADNLEVVTSYGDSRKAKVVGQDSINDIAVLEVDDRGINTVIDLGDSKKLRPGETVIAVGNPLGLGGTLTSGIVSYTSRLIPISLSQDGVYDWEQEVIQTDAAINEGNSGGALADLNGRLIGINTMKIADTGVEGLGFAIPVNEVMKTVDDLMLYGKVVRPYLGVYSFDLNNPYAAMSDEQQKDLNLPSHVTEGVIVLEAHGPAKDAGLKLNDVITQLDKQPIESTLELRRYLYENKKIGEDLEVTFYRNGKPQNVTVKLSDKPSEAELDVESEGAEGK
ncbi:serine protease Do [Fontibacillus phaseoli]|uniref:Serine protease Do n=1 Tax=Fontibacillus phaseoli TaxID=1416533 RepID=A0A369B7G2_9BACL|nr:trypsin-like peptidase domain-containing protein [Fontibacillus phaseoli]RCX15614.1 serine protease Do [Fontibacillus phaseoli]